MKHTDRLGSLLGLFVQAQSVLLAHGVDLEIQTSVLTERPTVKMQIAQAELLFRMKHEDGGTEIEFDSRVYRFYCNNSVITVYQRVETRNSGTAWRLVWQPAQRHYVHQAVRRFLEFEKPNSKI